MLGLRKEFEMNFETSYIKELAEILADKGLTEIVIEDGEKAISLRKEVKEVVAAQPVVAAPAPVAQACAPAMPAAEAPAKAECKASGTPITSPMVGTFYAASSPEAAPFVEVGKTISKGDTVCIIEAMKLMNEIEAEVAGKITQICVKNGDPVEYGQVLMYVE